MILKVKKKYNWHVSQDTSLHISKDKLWEIISKPNNLELYHPFCKKNPTIEWPGLKSIDQVHYYNGLIYERNFVNWIDNVGYDLLIGKKNEIQSFVSWRIKDLGDSSKLTISVYPYIFNMSNRMINFLPFFLFVKPSLKKYLYSISLGLSYYVKKNQPVTKNQFGTHKWFSN